MRALSVLGFDDLVVMRAAAGRVVAVTDRLLPDCVHSSRLIKKPPAWSFRRPNKAHRRFRKHALNLIDDGYKAMCRTDVKNYYGGIDIGLLEAELVARECESQAVTFLADNVRYWQVWSNLRGLPVGPEFSAVLGNAFLLVVDNRLRKLCHHARYMDDILLFAPEPERTRFLVTSTDEALTSLRLNRALDKTYFYDSPEEARAAIEDDLLASAFGWFDIDEDLGLERIYDIFDDTAASAPDDRNLAHFRASVKTLLNRSDPYAIDRLADDPTFANVDPSLSGEYFAAVGLGRTSVAEGMLSKLAQVPDDNFDALDLHYLKAMSQTEWGTVEGEQVRRIATDEARRPPIRCWAWQALAHTPVWTTEEAEAAADAEIDPMVRRGIVVTLRRAPERSRRLFLKHACRRFPRLRHTARWLESGQLAP